METQPNLQSPKPTPPYQNPKNKNISSRQKLTKQSVFFVWFISLITLGIYAPIWYFKKKSEFDGLNTQKKLKKGMIMALLVLTILYIPIKIINTYLPENLQNFLLSNIIINIIFIIISISFFILYIWIAFSTRAILNEIWISKRVERKVSWFFTLIFNIFYLQYEINRTIENKENEKRVGPWVFLILIPVIIFISVALIIWWVFNSLQSNLDSGLAAIEQNIGLLGQGEGS